MPGNAIVAKLGRKACRVLESVGLLSVPPMDCVLHLGAHKTGTTLIQGFMQDNPAIMKANRIRALPHAQIRAHLSYEYHKDATVVSAWLADRMASAERNKVRHFVFSFEQALGPMFEGGKGLYPQASENLTALAMFFAGRPVTIIYAIRDQADFIESNYIQHVQLGFAPDFRTYLSRIDMNHLSWASEIAKIRTAFPAAKICVVPFGTVIRKGQAAFLAHFFSLFTNADPKRFGNFAYESQQNISLGDKGLEIALAINRMGLTREERLRFRHVLQTHFSNRKYPRPQLLTEEERHWLAARYHDENRTLATHPPISD